MTSATPQTAVERIGLGIALAVAGLFCMAVMDACAKLLGAGYAISQVVLVRNALGALLVLLFLAATRGSLASLKPRRCSSPPCRSRSWANTSVCAAGRR